MRDPSIAEESRTAPPRSPPSPPLPHQLCAHTVNQLAKLLAIQYEIQSCSFWSTIDGNATGTVKNGELSCWPHACTLMLGEDKSSQVLQAPSILFLLAVIFYWLYFGYLVSYMKKKSQIIIFKDFFVIDNNCKNLCSEIYIKTQLKNIT